MTYRPVHFAAVSVVDSSVVCMSLQGSILVLYGTLDVAWFRAATKLDTSSEY